MKKNTAFRDFVCRLSSLWLLLLILIPLIRTQAQVFQRFIDALNQLPAEQRQASVDSFIHAGQPFPMTESDTLVTFVYQGNAQTVSLAGDATQWDPTIGLMRVDGTDFWYWQTTYEANARLDYKIVVNETDWILDPLNPFTCTGGFGPNSELRMPEYTIPVEIADNPSITRGVLLDTVFWSAYLGNSRTVEIYLPPGYNDSQKSYPVILFHDGADYISLGNIRNILDYLIAHKQIVPLIGVFIPPVDRTDEYAGFKKEAYRKFIINELMPYIDTKYRLDPQPSQRALFGVSNGGNIAIYIGMKNPESFGKICAQSSNIQKEIYNFFSKNDVMPLEIYLDIGKYDMAALIPLVENFGNVLKIKKYPLRYYVFPEGHSWGNWKAHLRLPLMQFFPVQSTGIEEKKSNRIH